MPHEPNHAEDAPSGRTHRLGLPGPEQSPARSPLLQVAVFASLAASISCLLLFAWIANEMREGDVQHFDSVVRNWVHQFASPGMTWAANAFSFIGSWVLAAVFIAALAIFLKLRWRRAATWLAVTMAGAAVMSIVLKYSFHRPRPTPFFGAVPTTWSFPSGHALFSFCIYGVLAGLIMARIKPLLWRIIIWCCAAALVAAIGLSRIYLGVHYPSDVLAGYLAAAVWVSTMVAMDRWRSGRGSISLGP